MTGRVLFNLPPRVLEALVKANTPAPHHPRWMDVTDPRDLERVIAVERLAAGNLRDFRPRSIVAATVSALGLMQREAALAKVRR